jgi:hypothetical protein
VVEGAKAVEFLNGTRSRGPPEWLGLGPIAREEGATVGVFGKAVEAFGEEVIVVPDPGDLVGILVGEFGADSHEELAAWGAGSGGLGGVGAIRDGLFNGDRFLRDQHWRTF